MHPKPRLLVATTNPGKQREYRALLREVPAKIVFPDELGIALEVEEDGATFRENAAKKARALARESGLLSIADDSGLEVDALGGEPGVLRRPGRGRPEAPRVPARKAERRPGPAPRPLRVRDRHRRARRGGRIRRRRVPRGDHILRAWNERVRVRSGIPDRGPDGNNGGNLGRGEKPDQPPGARRAGGDTDFAWDPNHGKK
jgi:hypothetical protein